jgi:hypothetical protein
VLPPAYRARTRGADSERDADPGTTRAPLILRGHANDAPRAFFHTTKTQSGLWRHNFAATSSASASKPSTRGGSNLGQKQCCLAISASRPLLFVILRNLTAFLSEVLLMRILAVSAALRQDRTDVWDDYVLIAAKSGWPPMMFMTRVRV